MLRFRLLFPTLIVAGLALAAGCGGGGGGGGTTPSVPTPGPSATIPVGPTPQSVTLTGGGYALSFTLPAETTGSTSTVTANLTTTLPSGVVAPSVRRAPKTIGTTTNALVYLTVTSSAQVGFSARPSLTYALPNASVIPPGDPAYVIFYDPANGSWINWLTGTISGATVTFAGAPGGVVLAANTQYVIALAYTAQAVPTATPAPTPSPRVTPAAYCSAYSTPVPNANSAPQPVTFTDRSGTGARIYLYVVSGAASQSNLQTQYLAANGTMTNFTTGATAPPIPLDCFPGSTGGTGLTFELPPPTNANQSGNLYIALATPGPGGALTSPLTFKGTSNGGYQGPTDVDPASATYVSTPFDYIEYTLPNGVTDVTQVDRVALPLLVSQPGSPSIGFQPGAYQTLLNAILADPIYKNLAVSGTINGNNVVSAIVAPEHGASWGFPNDWWYNNAYNSAYHNTVNTQGYIGYVLQQYQTPFLYTVNNVGGLSGNYCAQYDGSTYVNFYSVGSATSCSSLGALKYAMPAHQMLIDDGTINDGYCENPVFAQPFGPGSPPFSGQTDNTAFYLWKAMVLDLTRGTALQSGTHPIGGWSTTPSGLPFTSTWYLDPAYSTYAHLVHLNMTGYGAYAMAYDEPGGFAPTFTSNPSLTMNVTIQQIPSFTRTLPIPGSTSPPVSCP